MRIASLNVGLPREVTWHGRRVTTGIYKTPVNGRVAMRRLNLDGDRQADLRVHGGEFKAVYCYPHEHYVWWRRELGGRELEPGMFGENLTTEGVDETTVHVGDRFAIGSAQVIVTQPRMPCYKLGIKFGSDAMVQQFLDAGRSGFYVAVQREGDVAAGDAMTLLARDPERVRIADINRLYVQKLYAGEDAAIVKRAIGVAALPPAWKEHFRERLAGR